MKKNYLPEALKLDIQRLEQQFALASELAGCSDARLDSCKRSYARCLADISERGPAFFERFPSTTLHLLFKEADKLAIVLKSLKRKSGCAAQQKSDSVSST